MINVRPVLLSIVIVSYNVKDYLEECLVSIPMGGVVDPEVWVVDNNSTDGSVQMVQEKFPSVKLIANDFNAGFPKANNQAIRQCRGSFILLLNPDTVVLKDSLKILIDYLKDNPGFGLAGPKLLNTDGSHQFSVMPFIRPIEIVLETFYLHLWYRKIHDHRRKSIQAAEAVDAISGAAIMTKREVFDRAGLLDKDLFWTEDMEFCYRATKSGYRVAYVPQSEIIHHVGASGKKNQRVMISNQVLSKVRYFSKNHTFVTYVICWFFRLLHILSRLILLVPLSLIRKSFYIKFDAYFYTLKRFVTGKY